MDNTEQLYKEEAKAMMLAAENSVSSNRIEQIREFALNMGYKRIGIAHCITFTRESKTIMEYLSRDFDVFTADCKIGRLQRSNLFGGSRGGVLCNPAGQAEYLNSRDCSLNLSVGLCVGHDVIFNDLSKAPVTTIFTKDFSNGHDAAATVEHVKKSL